MAYSNLIAFFVILATAVTLNAHGVTNIQTASQAAVALKPIAGDFASALFAAGIVGTGLLAIPTLAGSAAYALSEALGWREGLELKFSEARGFYIIIGVAILGGVAGQLFAARPDQGAVLERGGQRGRRRAADGDHHAAVQPQEPDGRLRRHAVAALGRLGGHRGDGCRRGADVRDNGRLGALSGRR